MCIQAPGDLPITTPLRKPPEDLPHDLGLLGIDLARHTGDLGPTEGILLGRVLGRDVLVTIGAAPSVLPVERLALEPAFPK